MTRRDELLAFLDGLLRPVAFRDACPNGLQVAGRERIRKIATCPSVSAEFFHQAAALEADTLLVHHGLFWDRDSRAILEPLAERLKLLLTHGMNLLAYHLPLDAHRELGNNAQLADLLGLEQRDWEFGHRHGTAIGVCGRLPAPVQIGALADALEGALGGPPVVFDFGPEAIERVGIVSGGAGDISMLMECSRTGCQALVTGNVFEQTVSVARELGLGAVAAGHYNSEKLGVRALGEKLRERFGIEVVHIDVPNPV